MKKQLIESESIGGQSPLTKEEEEAISKYLAEKKAKTKKKLAIKPASRKGVSAS